MRIAVTERCIFGHCTMQECMQCGAGADELFSAQRKTASISTSSGSGFSVSNFSLSETDSSVIEGCLVSSVDVLPTQDRRLSRTSITTLLVPVPNCFSMRSFSEP